MNNKKIAIIDGYGFVFRAYHSLPPLNRGDGTPVGAVYGFTNMLIKLMAGLDVSHLAIAFDSGSKSFRNDISPEYKANRPPCPEDLKPQFPIIRQAAEALNISVLEQSGVEADDIIATIAKEASDQGYEVLVVSSDKDLMQLVSDRVTMYDAMKNKLIGEEEVREKFSVGPNKILDLLSLIGDTADNITGARGIGPKTAAELLNEFDNLENIYQNLNQIKERKRNLLTEGKENVQLAKRLISLKFDVKTGHDIDDFKIKNIDPRKLVDFLHDQGFRSLLARVKKEFNIDYTPKSGEKTQEEIIIDQIKYHQINSSDEADKIYNDILSNGQVCVDYLIDKQDLIVSLASAKSGNLPKGVFFLSLNGILSTDISSGPDLFSANDKKQTPKYLINLFKDIVINSGIKKILLNSKEFYRKISTRLDLDIYQDKKYLAIEDLSVINHLLSSSVNNNLRSMIDLNLSVDIEQHQFGKILGEIEKKDSSEDLQDEDLRYRFLAFKNIATYQLFQILSPQVFSQKLNECYQSYEKPLLVVLAIMENNGIKVDKHTLIKLSTQFGKEINSLSEEIYQLAGCEFNIASPKQLSEILFDKMQLDTNQKSKKTGALSTNSKVLEELEMQGHEIASKILRYRKITKLKNTYTDSLQNDINQKTSRIHSTFSNISTITGRLSSFKPNLQNIPIKSEEGRKIRSSFIAKEGNVLISADYSQIELRVIAHIAKVKNLIQAFKEDKDIHKITASQVFKIPEEGIDDQTRYKAKAINFGIIYGISAFGLGRQLKISKQEAGDYIKSYLETYPEISNFMESAIATAKKQGYIQTLSGRKCFIKDINNQNPILRAEGERLAINAPIQGSAADIIKKAMINLQQKITNQKIDATIILQIHDELIIETPKEKAQELSQIIKKEMENAVIMDLPIKVDFNISNHW